MARIPYLDENNLAHVYHDLLVGNFNAFRALAHSPNRARVFRDMVYGLKSSRLDPRLRELAMIQIGWLDQCGYEWFHHVQVALENGATEEDVRNLMEGTKASYRRMGEAAYLVLLATRQMYAGPSASPDVIARLERLLEKECLVDLLILIGFYLGAVRVLATLEIDLEPQYFSLRDRFPLRMSHPS